ncbi:MAG TPA: corrinoid protein [Planctomycetota bacterium]|jgi:5-methyltetrahydrofolate--homocysteine methyltransferase
MADMEAIKMAVRQGSRPQVLKLVEDALAEGVSASQILNQGLIAGIRLVGELFSKNEIFVPEMLIAARAMQAALDKLKPLLIAAGEKPKGTVVAATVKGDLHDIGKNLVCIMIRGAGYQVIDLGVDCSAEKFIAAANENKAQVIVCSALLTTTMPYMKTIVDQVKASGCKAKVIIGGAPVTQTFADKIGADGYGADANEAVLITEKLLAV